MSWKKEVEVFFLWEVGWIPSSTLQASFFGPSLYAKQQIHRWFLISLRMCSQTLQSLHETFEGHFANTLHWWQYLYCKMEKLIMNND